MKKIVIVTDHTEKSANLIARARMIFPESEIEIINRTDMSDYQNASYYQSKERTAGKGKDIKPMNIL